MKFVLMTAGAGKVSDSDLILLFVSFFKLRERAVVVRRALLGFTVVGGQICLFVFVRGRMKGEKKVENKIEYHAFFCQIAGYHSQ